MTAIAHIETARLLLRAPHPDDAPVFFEIHGDPGTNRFNPAGAMTRERADAAIASDIGHWTRHGYGYWAVARRDDPVAVIGFGGLALRDFGGTQRANLGFRFATPTWGRGYATELGAAALEAGWSLLMLAEIWASARENHPASLAVLARIGMTAVERVADPREGVAASVWHVARRPGTSSAAADGAAG